MSTPSLHAFESADIEPGGFDHEAHVYVAWRYLQKYDQLQAIARYRAGLKNLVSKFGAEDKYHETITWFYLLVIAERMKGEGKRDWKVFVQQNRELFTGKPSLLERHYSPERLGSASARAGFLLPDRAS